MKKTPIVINFFGAPGSGKSTGAATVFCELKKSGHNVELITEFAKDKTWEQNAKALSVQEYIFGKQSYRLARCRDDVDIIVTDSPLPLSLIYNSNPVLDEHFDNVVMNIFNSYKNCNYFINRVKPYNPKGRYQTEAESDALVNPIKKLLLEQNINFSEISGDDIGYQKVVSDIKSLL